MTKVDLTENSVYSRLNQTASLRQRLYAYAPPWDLNSQLHTLRVVGSDDDLKSAPLVYTGDAESINFRREYAEVEQGQRCECCGNPITVIPWEKSNGLLCPDCLERLETQVHGEYNTPWQKVELWNSRSVVPWWFDL